MNSKKTRLKFLQIAGRTFFILLFFLTFFFSVSKGVWGKDCCKSGTYDEGKSCCVDSLNNCLIITEYNCGSSETCAKDVLDNYVCAMVGEYCCSNGYYDPSKKCCILKGVDCDAKLLQCSSGDACAQEQGGAWICTALGSAPSNCCISGSKPVNETECLDQSGTTHSNECVGVGLECLVSQNQCVAIGSGGGNISSPYDPCANLSDNPAKSDDPYDQCKKCVEAAESGTWTALGCIPNEPADLVGWIITVGAGIAGGIAFLLILWGAAQIVLSSGVPEKIQAGKEIITSAVVGLVFIFCSILILRIIGVQILGIPGWS